MSTVKVGAQYNATAPTVLDKQSADLQIDSGGNLKITTGAMSAGVDRSGSITTGGTAQTLAAANTARVMLVGQNIDPAEDMWINEIGGTATANTIGSWLVPAKATFSIETNRAVSVVAATTGHKWTAEEF